MKSDTWIGKKGYRYWYYKYRDSEYFSIAIMVSTVLVCVLLIFNFIIPQLTTWFSIRDEVVATQARIAVLQENINYMNTLDKRTMNAQLETATTALPPEKDFGIMLNVLTEASLKSGVALNDFTFQVGNVDSDKDQIIDPRHKDLSNIKMTVVVTGPVTSVRTFIRTLEESIPLSEVVDLDGSGQTISISMQFYQKNLPEVDIKPEDPIIALSPDKTALLEKIAAWNRGVVADFSNETASGGATPLF